MKRKKAPDSIVSYDQDSMELEWSKQGRRVKRYGDQLADAKFKENTLEGRLKLVEAQLSALIRQSPTDYGLSSTSDERVKQTAIMQPKYQRTLLKLNLAKYWVDSCKAALGGLASKEKGMVETLKGQFAGFYGDPRDPRNDVKIKQERKRRK